MPNNLQIKGTVIRGRGFGKTLGYPTANLLCDSRAEIESGVYVVKVKINSGQERGLLIIGTKSGSPEIYILDWQGDLYGKKIEVEVLEKISEIEEFDSDGGLIKKIESDLGKAREWFSAQNI